MTTLSELIQVYPGEILADTLFQSSTTTTTITKATSSSSSTSIDASTLQPIPLRLGSGLVSTSDSMHVMATKLGILTHQEPNRYYVQSNGRRYIPAVGDNVIGIVTDRNAENYRIRLHGSHNAFLPVLAFDGASKRNKPNLSIGALVYARVAALNPHVDIELTCTASTGYIRKDWMSGESMYGELKDGTVVTVNLAHARRLLHPKAALLTVLGKSIPFEVAIGMNGYVWVHAGNIRYTTIIANAITRSETLNETESSEFAERLLVAAAASDA